MLCVLQPGLTDHVPQRSRIPLPKLIYLLEDIELCRSGARSPLSNRSSFSKCGSNSSCCALTGSSECRFQKRFFTCNYDIKVSPTKATFTSWILVATIGGRCISLNNRIGPHSDIAMAPQCQACQRTFKDKRALRQHLLSPSHPTDNICAFRNNALASKRALHQHIYPSQHHVSKGCIDPEQVAPGAEFVTFAAPPPANKCCCTLQHFCGQLWRR